MDESERETADTNGEGETLPDPQGAEVSAWEQQQKEREKVEKRDRESESEGEKCVAWLQ